MRRIFILILSITAITCLGYSQTMVVNEIMFKPGPSLSGCDQKLVSQPAPTCGREYIELYNSDCNNDYDLSGYVLASASSVNPGLYNGGAICFPPGTIVPAGSFLIIGGANDHNPSVNGTYDYLANSFDFKIPNYLGTQYLCLNTLNTYWFLANVDGWMALFEPNGNIHTAVYWAPDPGDILTTPEFNLAPCSPSAYTGTPLPSAKTIYQNNPGSIVYMGNPMNITTGLTFSRMPDGGAFQSNLPPTIGPLRTDRCNDGNCIACGNLLLTSTPDTCSSQNGSIRAQIVNQTTSPPPYTFSLSGPVNFGPINTSTNPYFFNNLPAGTYIVSVDDSFVPSNHTVDTIVVGNAGTVNILSITSTPASCNASDGTATVNVSGGNGTFNYLWNTNPPQTTQTATGLPQGQYTVTITSGGCTATEDVLVNGESGPTVTYSSTPEYCNLSNGTAIVIANGGSGNYTYTWNTTPPLNTAAISGLQSGSYTVTVSDGGNCSPVITITISEIPGPDADLLINPLFGQPGQNIDFQSLNNTNVMLWEWNFGNNFITQTNIPSASYSYSSPGTYTVWLIVTDNNGCQDSVSKNITIVDFEIPNIITPNSDGINDIFQIRGLESVPDKKLIIYNRWGKTLYNNSDYQNDWGGENFSDGVYYYVLIVPGLEKEFNGTITILR